MNMGGAKTIKYLILEVGYPWALVGHQGSGVQVRGQPTPHDIMYGIYPRPFSRSRGGLLGPSLVLPQKTPSFLGMRRERDAPVENTGLKSVGKHFPKGTRSGQDKLREWTVMWSESKPKRQESPSKEFRPSTRKHPGDFRFCGDRSG